LLSERLVNELRVKETLVRQRAAESDQRVAHTFKFGPRQHVAELEAEIDFDDGAGLAAELRGRIVKKALMAMKAELGSTEKLADASRSGGAAS
jgi:hypothetical protein